MGESRSVEENLFLSNAGLLGAVGSTLQLKVSGRHSRFQPGVGFQLALTSVVRLQLCDSAGVCGIGQLFFPCLESYGTAR